MKICRKIVIKLLMVASLSTLLRLVHGAGIPERKTTVGSHCVGTMSCRPQCITFRIRRSDASRQCNSNEGIFSSGSSSSSWDLSKSYVVDCQGDDRCISPRNEPQKWKKAKKGHEKIKPKQPCNTIPWTGDLMIKIKETGNGNQEGCSSYYQLTAEKELFTYCSVYLCPKDECCIPDQMGSQLDIEVANQNFSGFVLLQARLALSMSFTGDVFSHSTDNRLGPLYVEWMDEPAGCRSKDFASNPPSPPVALSGLTSMNGDATDATSSYYLCQDFRYEGMDMRRALMKQSPSVQSTSLNPSQSPSVFTTQSLSPSSSPVKALVNSSNNNSTTPPIIAIEQTAVATKMPFQSLHPSCAPVKGSKAIGCEPMRTVLPKDLPVTSPPSTLSPTLIVFDSFASLLPEPTRSESKKSSIEVDLMFTELSSSHRRILNAQEVASFEKFTRDFLRISASIALESFLVENQRLQITSTDNDNVTHVTLVKQTNRHRVVRRRRVQLDNEPGSMALTLRVVMQTSVLDDATLIVSVLENNWDGYVGYLNFGLENVFVNNGIDSGGTRHGNVGTNAAGQPQVNAASSDHSLLQLQNWGFLGASLGMALLALAIVVAVRRHGQENRLVAEAVEHSEQSVNEVGRPTIKGRSSSKRIKSPKNPGASIPEESQVILAINRHVSRISEDGAVAVSEESDSGWNSATSEISDDYFADGPLHKDRTNVGQFDYDNFYVESDNGDYDEFSFPSPLDDFSCSSPEKTNHAGEQDTQVAEVEGGDDPKAF